MQSNPTCGRKQNGKREKDLRSEIQRRLETNLTSQSPPVQRKIRLSLRQRINFANGEQSSALNQTDPSHRVGSPAKEILRGSGGRVRGFWNVTRFLGTRRSPRMQSSFDARGTSERTNEREDIQEEEEGGGGGGGRERIMDRRTDEGSWSRMRFSRSPGVLQGNNHGRLNRPRERYRLAGPNRYHLVSRSGDRRESKRERGQAGCNSL